MSLTLERWLTAPVAVVQEIFSLGGPLSRIMPDYRPNEAQVRYASILALAAVRGADPVTAGRVTPLEGGTGIGKSLAILVVGGINAKLRGKRTLVTTFTRFLNRQIAGKDGTIAMAVVGEVVGSPCRIAVRRSRSAFASPQACRYQSKLVTEEALASDSPAAEALHETANALWSLAEWTDGAIARARLATAEGREADYIAAFDGLIETYLEENDQDRIPLSQMPFELYTIEKSAPGAEQLGWDIYDRNVEGADILVGTHAALVIDQSIYGRLLDGQKAGYSLVVIDEANRAEDAGALALGVNRAVSSFTFDLRSIQPILASMDDKARRIELSDVLQDHSAVAEDLLTALRPADMKRQPAEVVVSGSEPWLEMLSSLYQSSGVLLDALTRIEGDLAKAAASRLSNRQGDLDAIFDAIRRRKVTNEAKGGKVPAGDRAFSSVRISFSPIWTEPSIVVRPDNGSRVLSRLWSDPKGPAADAVVVTSATLGMPAGRGKTDYTSIMRNIGIRDGEIRVNADLSENVEMRRFGKLRELLLAHPESAKPSRAPKDRGADGDTISPEWVANVAAAIGLAYADVWREDGRNHVVVLCNGFADIAAIAAALPPEIDRSDVVARGRHQTVDQGFDWLADRGRGILLTCGAYDGIDRPGLIDHLVVPRLPYGSTGDAFHKAWFDADGVRHESRRVEKMAMTLKQAVGRPFRKSDDEAKIWILDPRIGLPPVLQRRLGIMAHRDSQPSFLLAIPHRFEQQVMSARVLPAKLSETGR